MSATQLCYSSSSLITHFSSITFHRFYNPTIPAHTWKITQAALTSISLLTVQNSQKCFLYRTVQYVFDLVPQLLCKLNLKIKLIFFICLIADSWIHTNNICSFWLKYCFFYLFRRYLTSDERTHVLTNSNLMLMNNPLAVNVAPLIDFSWLHVIYATFTLDQNIPLMRLTLTMRSLIVGEDGKSVAPTHWLQQLWVMNSHVVIIVYAVHLNCSCLHCPHRPPPFHFLVRS